MISLNRVVVQSRNAMMMDRNKLTESSQHVIPILLLPMKDLLAA